ncbi:hypothetical protein, partial [Desulforamulus ruminis]|uniref:hypothetical protein n=1 Tax=Desulforamulus ruminis TaxID=1564 RepID=UPI0023541CC2
TCLPVTQEIAGSTPVSSASFIERYQSKPDSKMFGLFCFLEIVMYHKPASWTLIFYFLIKKVKSPKRARNPV